MDLGVGSLAPDYVFETWGSKVIALVPWRNCETYKHVLLGQGGSLPLAKQTWRDSMRTKKLRGQRGPSANSLEQRYPSEQCDIQQQTMEVPTTILAVGGTLIF